MHLSRLSVKTRRSLNLLVVVALLSASSAIAVAAMPATLEATPSNANGSRLYVGYDAQLTAEMPADWQPDMALLYDYAGSDGFVFSHSLDVSPRSLDVACAAMANDDRFAGHGQSQSTTWRDKPACVVRFSGGGNRGPVALVFAHPHPAEDGHNQFVSIFVDAPHFDSVLETVSFDPAKVTPTAYLDAAIDLMQARSLWRAGVDWPKVRTKAHSILAEQPVGPGMRQVQIPILYVISQIKLAGGDPHTQFYFGGFTPTAFLDGPTGQRLSGDLGYLSVPGFIGTDEDGLRFVADGWQAIQDAGAGGSCGWIVDLRGNTGGNIFPMYGAIAPLLPPEIALTFRDANGKEIAIQHMGNGRFSFAGQTLGPEVLPVYEEDPGVSRAPVAVLIGPHTVSAGEATALAFAGRDNTRYFGIRSAGVTTLPETDWLFDGSVLRIAVWWMVGPRGAIYPDGISPDVEVSADSVSQDLNDDLVVQAAKEWLEQQPGCSGQSGTPPATPLPTPKQ